jgi:hypothetical protein
LLEEGRRLVAEDPNPPPPPPPPPAERDVDVDGDDGDEVVATIACRRGRIIGEGGGGGENPPHGRIAASSSSSSGSGSRSGELIASEVMPTNVVILLRVR